MPAVPPSLGGQEPDATTLTASGKKESSRRVGYQGRRPEKGQTSHPRGQKILAGAFSSQVSVGRHRQRGGGKRGGGSHYRRGEEKKGKIEEREVEKAGTIYFKNGLHVFREGRPLHNLKIMLAQGGRTQGKGRKSQGTPGEVREETKEREKKP